MRNKEPNRFQVLSLSGGGYRGLHVAHCLELIEQKIQGPIARHFDLLAGTSIGGIIGLALALEIPAAEIRKALEELGPKLFPSLPPDFKTIQGLGDADSIVGKAGYGLTHIKQIMAEAKQATRAWYDPTPLRELLSSREFFGTKKLGDVLHPIIVPAINYGNGLPKFFKTDHHPKFTFDRELYIVDIALGTSAAPVYFPAHQVGDFRIVDGGLVANDPTQVAVHEAMMFFGIRPPLYGDPSTGQDDLNVLSIGTLSPKRIGDLTKPLDQGLVDWGSGVFDLASTAQEALAAFMVDQHMLPDKVIRLPTLESKPETAPNLADATPGATSTLKSSAAALIQTAFGKDEFNALFKHQSKNLNEVRHSFSGE